MKQTGSALFMVIVLLALSAALLGATRRQLDQSLSRTGDEQQYLYQTSQAFSALAWGSQQTWSGSAGWQCRQERAAGWRSCLYQAESSPALLRGESGTASIALYQWVTWKRESGRVVAVPHGWLDYCPLTEEERCNPDEETARF
ncbi:DUF2509 family protein [Erwinia sp. MMLR14_017]|uniref:DUF2509 family protein n=1 Tax=Erwinia sp. MMLR14_017 TaxID=3093842 RepID=UPI0029903EEF|nr:DUF2509 family protein [Erwinia sp. MMLR14_017]MDW8845647.1 DUF2509 family protein [Erwinia sp. MMLR14_017]